MSPPSLKELVSTGRIEQVPADQEVAAAVLEEAHRHLLSADAIAEIDPSGAYSLLYDASRKAVSAHMTAKGFRASSDRPGSHAAVIAYATAVLKAGGASELLRNFDRMRRTRHRVEYDGTIIGSRQLQEDLQQARRIVDLVESAWPAPS